MFVFYTSKLNIVSKSSVIRSTAAVPFIFDELRYNILFLLFCQYNIRNKNIYFLFIFLSSVDFHRTNANRIFFFFLIKFVATITSTHIEYTVNL